MTSSRSILLLVMLNLAAAGCGKKATDPTGGQSARTTDGGRTGGVVPAANDCNGLPVAPEGDRVDLYQPVLLLRDVEGLSTKETAEVLDIAEDAVKTRLHRARLAVRQELDGYLKGQR